MSAVAEHGDCRFMSLDLAIPFDEIFENVDSAVSDEGAAESGNKP